MKKNCCIVIPAYEPEEEIIHYVSELLSAEIGPVVVVDDGSGASYGAVFSRVEEMKNCTVLHHSENQGKGAAIKTAATWYLRGGESFQGIITADCDGQHRVKDVKKVAEAMVGEPGSLTLGCRSFGTDTPRKSAVGNRMMSLAIKAFYGIELADTQTGLRGIPHRYIRELLLIPGMRYEYELNMLICMKRSGVSFATVPIETIYFNDNKGTHFRALRDSALVFSQLFLGPQAQTDRGTGPRRYRLERERI